MSGELILVVDDSREIVRHLTEYLLPAEGYRAIAAFNGRQGLELIREHEPDLVMLDLNLPEMTGLDVLQELAQDAIGTPVLLMTGYGSEKSAVEAFRLGVKDYLVKPFTVDEVIDTVERALVEVRLQHDKQRLVEKLARTEGEMRRQIKEMRTLFSMGKTLTALLGTGQVLDQALQGALDLTHAERSTIWLPDETGHILEANSKTARRQLEHMGGLSVEGSQIGEVYQSGEVVRAASFSSEGIKIEPGDLARAILCVPLTIRGKVVGVFGVSNHEAPRAFSERDELLLSALSDYVAIALDNARVYQASDTALTARMDELRALLGITRTITASLDLDEVAQLTIKEVHASWDIEACSIWVLNEKSRQIHLLVNVGTAKEEIARVEVEIGEGIVGHVVETGVPFYTNNAATDSRHLHHVDQRTGFETKTLLCVPLVFRNQTIGALQLLNKQDGLFSDEDVDRASSIAIAVAIAVTNAQLFAESTARQQLLEAMLEHNGNPVMITDQEGRLLLLNWQAREQLLLTEEAIGRLAVEVLQQPDLVTMLAHLPESSTGIQRREVKLGESLYSLATMASIPDYGWILVLQDITYLKEMDSVKSNFVATVSHDLRAPLNSIIGFASGLEQMGPLTEEQREFVSRIVNSVERMTNLVTALVDLARVDARVEQVRQLCDLAEIVRRVLVDLQGQAMTRDISLRLDIQEEPAAVYGDPTQLHQAVSNLVDNAIKYSATGKQVGVVLGAQDKNLFIKVQDTGRGIPTRDLPHIFEKFYRGKDNETLDGAGLGLTLVRSIAEAHGGWVWVESEQGRGSTFTLQLPSENSRHHEGEHQAP